MTILTPLTSAAVISCACPGLRCPRTVAGSQSNHGPVEPRPKVPNRAAFRTRRRLRAAGPAPAPGSARYSARLMFVSSDRTWPPRRQNALTSANVLPLVGANGPEQTTAVTSRGQPDGARTPECDPNWRTSAVTSYERNHRRVTTDGNSATSSTWAYWTASILDQSQ